MMGREHWKEITLDNVCKIQTGKWDANHADVNGKYRFYTCAADYQFSNTKRFSGECIILPGNGANVGEVYYYDGDFDAYQRTYVLSDIIIDPKFLFLHLKFQWKEINRDKQFGSATNFIRIGNFLEYSVPLPPISEQIRIVEKLDAILPNVKSAKDRLENINKIKEKLIYSLLLDNGEFSKEIELGNFIIESDERIGPGWKDVRMIGVDQSKGIVPLRTSKTSGFENYKIVRKNNFVYNPMRINVGSIALYNEHEIAITSPDYVVFSVKEKLSSNYLLNYLKSKKGLMQIDNNTKGAVRERLYFENICKVKINESATGDIEVIEKLFRCFNLLEQKKEYLYSLLDNIEQSVLAKAFRGELVDPDPDDEPADALLARILEEKGKIEDEGRSRKARKRKGKG